MTSHQQPILIKHYKLCLLVIGTAEGICSILNTNKGIKHGHPLIHVIYLCTARNFKQKRGYEENRIFIVRTLG